MPAPTRLFPTGEGLKIADRLEPKLAALTADDDPVEAINGVALLLTRRLGGLERTAANRDVINRWVHQYIVFLAGRFGKLNDETD